MLGALGVLDGGETDWTLVTISVDDPRAKTLSTVADVEKQMPGFLDATRNWFRIYKTPDADVKPNEFAFDGEYLGAEKAHEVVREAHEAWQKLIKQPDAKLCT